jgi:hypothetical protein
MKPKPKPKPKTKRSHVTKTAQPTFPPTMATTMAATKASDHIFLESVDQMHSSSATTTLESTGLVAILSGVGVACMVAIVALVRKPEVQHEPLPDSSENAVDTML